MLALVPERTSARERAGLPRSGGFTNSLFFTAIAVAPARFQRGATRIGVCLARCNAPTVFFAPMKIRLFDNKVALGSAAAAHAASMIRRAIAERGKARILAATGNSQLEFLEALTAERDIAWGEVEMFHLDEYVGLSIEHPASFRKYLFERLINKVRVGRYHLLDGEHDPERTCREEGEALRSAPIDVAFGGIGENGHLAFNDPPADFATEKPYLIVRLDEACRRQQVGEGWFKTLADVPDRAISISVRQFMKAHTIICAVPDSRKAEAVKRCLEGPISPLAPSSILRTHPDATVYLDRHSAALLTEKPEMET
jgi:glucosamine-6-phosphate deaminase